MVKCSVCKNKIELTFLNKLVGTYVRDSNGKRKPVCRSCQKTYSLAEIKEKLS